MGRRLRLLAWLVPLGAAAVSASLATADPADLPYFAHAARTLLSARWTDTFADPSLQVGPLQLALIGVGDRIGGLSFLVYAIELGLAALLVFVAGRLLADRPHKAAMQLGIGLAAVLSGLIAGAYGYGHPAQMAVPLLWVLAGLEARTGRSVRAGALLGLSAAFETWGVLGIPMLLLAPDRRRILGGLAALTAVTSLFYLPFVLGGTFDMFEHRWTVEGWTLVHLIVPTGSAFPWTLRLIQGAAAVAAGAAVALLAGRGLRAVWMVGMVVVAVRLMLDPTLYSWYWLGFETIALVAAAELATDLPARWQHSLRVPGWALGERRG